MEGYRSTSKLKTSCVIRIYIMTRSVCFLIIKTKFERRLKCSSRLIFYIFISFHKKINLKNDMTNYGAMTLGYDGYEKTVY